MSSLGLVLGSLSSVAAGVVAVVLLLALALIGYVKRKQLRSLPENTSSGTPLSHSLREKVLAGVCCLFVVFILGWLWFR